jgi:hypothetical protein
MGLKLWKHNHDRQIAEDCMDFRVIFAPGKSPACFLMRGLVFDDVCNVR